MTMVASGLKHTYTLTSDWANRTDANPSRYRLAQLTARHISPFHPPMTPRTLDVSTSVPGASAGYPHGSKALRGSCTWQMA